MLHGCLLDRGQESSAHVFFIVGRPVDSDDVAAVAEEFRQFGDLIFLDRIEEYDAANSILPFKTQACVSACCARIHLPV